MNSEVVSESAIPMRPTSFRPRLDQLDLLRGAVMILMALDHVRDFVSHEATLFDPTDLSRTTVAIFLTRWITHYCAPIFCFLAGTGAFLSLGRGKTRRNLSWFLLTRGLWLILLELTVVQFGWGFTIDPHFLFVQVIWALGCSMVVLSALVFWPLWAVATFGLVMIAGHNLLDPIQPAAFGWASGFWKILHVQERVTLPGGVNLFVAYPLIPWVGVMAAGFAFGSLLRRERAPRRRILFWLGLAISIAFVLLRLTNGYGDPSRWSVQTRPEFTALSFIDCTKYPPSLLYLLMTLGPAILLLAIFDRPLGNWAKPIIVFGRVPLFYYLLHLPLIHAVAATLACVRYGFSWSFWHGAPFGPTASQLPADYGYGLFGVYLIWGLIILLLYPACRWFAQLKQRRADAWLSYF